MLIDDFRAEFQRYRRLGERAVAQIDDQALNAMPATDANSIAMIMRHIAGNFVSRFTDFLTVDGEKASRDRDAEFDIRHYSRADIERHWHTAWQLVADELGALTDSDLERTVTIRGQAMTVHAALSRSLAHVAYHVGEMVVLARMHAGANWESLSIARGKSVEFNQGMTRSVAAKTGPT